MVWDFLKRWFGRADEAPKTSAAKSQNEHAAPAASSSEEEWAPAREISMEGPVPVDIVYEMCGGNCPVQADGTFNGYYFYFRGRGEGWTMEVGIPKGNLGWDGISAWDYEEKYEGPKEDAGWMSEDEARVFVEKAARLWHADEGWKACDALDAEVQEEYRQRAELEKAEAAEEAAPADDADAPREISMDGPCPVEIEYEWIAGYCPMQAVGTFNGYSFYFRGRGIGWGLEVGAPVGHPGWYEMPANDAWYYEEDYTGPAKDAGWMGEDEAMVFVEKCARLWHQDEGWKACDEMAVKVEAEYRARGELD